jgi:DNA polymerase III subunit epsilon
MSAWWRRGAATAADDARWVLLDVESSGLDPTRDRLLAIAAIALTRQAGAPRLALGDSFEVLLRQPDAPVDKANILVHGIGVGAQRDGAEPAQALAAFERWVGRSPLLGFHVAFDEALIQRAMRATLGRALANPWIDLADVARVVRPDVTGRSLDEWMDALGVRCAVRHQAAADTLATAELLLKLWPQVLAQRQGDDWRALSRLAAQRRWLPR